MEEKVKLGADNEKQAVHWTSSGIITHINHLKCEVVAGNSEGKILLRSRTIGGDNSDAAFSGKFGSLSTSFKPRWQWEGYKHEWRCYLTSCMSLIDWSAFCVNEVDGTKVVWDAVEVAAQETPEGINPEHINRYNYYRHFDRTDRFGVDWQKDGHDPDFSSGAKCWVGGSWYFWGWQSHA